MIKYKCLFPNVNWETDISRWTQVDSVETALKNAVPPLFNKEYNPSDIENIKKVLSEEGIICFNLEITPKFIRQIVLSN